MAIQVTWYSHACFLIQTDAANLLVDPFFSGNPLSPIHYNTFDVIKQDPHAWAEQVYRETGAEARTGSVPISIKILIDKDMLHPILLPSWPVE